MSRFRGTVRGSRGEASRLGSADSGLVVNANGWTVGGMVEMFPNYTNPEKDCVALTLTDGSDGAGDQAFIGTFSRDDLQTWNWNAAHFAGSGILRTLADTLEDLTLAVTHTAAATATDPASVRMQEQLRKAREIVLAVKGSGSVFHASERRREVEKLGDK